MFCNPDDLTIYTSQNCNREKLIPVDLKRILKVINRIVHLLLGHCDQNTCLNADTYTSVLRGA